MDQMSNFELLEIFLLAQESVDAQFQYWLAVSFAVIVASFAAGGRLTSTIRMWLTILYLLAVGVFVLKFLGSQSAVGMYYGELVSRDLGNPSPTLFGYGTSIMIWFRRLLFCLGTVTTIWFLYSNDTRSLEETPIKQPPL